jgi:hypothetical protein
MGTLVKNPIGYAASNDEACQQGFWWADSYWGHRSDDNPYETNDARHAAWAHGFALYHSLVDDMNASTHAEAQAWAAAHPQEVCHVPH